MDRYMPMKKSKGRLYELLQSGFLEILLDGKKRKKANDKVAFVICIRKKMQEM